MKSWSDFQEELEGRFADSQSLTEVLHYFYDHQCEADVVSSAIVKDICSAQKMWHPGRYHYFKLQFNPHRANRGLSEVENQSPKHIIPYKDGVPCFCCVDNIKIQWPKERGFSHLIHNQELVFLPNISPVFKHHFTVVTPNHIPQKTDIPLIIKTAVALPGFWVVQNGSQAGATNPWHFHLQAFNDDIPLAEYPIWHTWLHSKTVHIHKMDHPASVYRFDIADPSSEDAIQTVKKCVADFEALDPDNRVNIMAVSLPQGFRLYMGARNTRFKTDRYKTGQPGYAEMGGVISTISPNAFEEWKQKGWDFYAELMTDIRLSNELEEAFENNIKSL